ncbi:MAG: hypothetical protein ACRD4R_13405 [Candidatus Acidiferrales bacterium]
MTLRWFRLPVMVVLSVAVAGASVHSDKRGAQIRRALSAAPAAIAARAMVAIRGKNGKWIILRHGDDGWTCIPASSGDPDPLPACFDANGLVFIEAFDTGHPPDPNKPGYSYMLQGGSAWSNLDPFAAKLPPGAKDYIHIPPHIMILDAKIANESGLPLKDAHPDTRRPFVMFGGTKYAILIIPVQ